MPAFPQVERARRRLEGAESMLGLVAQHRLLPSVRYALLCGWQGLLAYCPSDKYVHEIRFHAVRSAQFHSAAKGYNDAPQKYVHGS